MKMISSTSTTSTNGVTLISASVPACRAPAASRLPPPLTEIAYRYSPKLRSAMFRNSSEKSSMRAPISRMPCPK